MADGHRTDIQVLVYVLENGVRHVARAIQTAAHEKSAMVPGVSKKSQGDTARKTILRSISSGMGSGSE